MENGRLSGALIAVCVLGKWKSSRFQSLSW
jgi:hypothetical protein